MQVDWILMAPQYHFAMGIVALICLYLLCRINSKLNRLIGLHGCSALPMSDNNMDVTGN